MFKLAFFIFFFYFLYYVRGDFNLTVVHISDFQSNWLEFDENKHDCSKEESSKGQCYGGIARLVTFLRDIREKEKNVLVLSSGEFFLGRTLYALHGWKMARHMLPRLELDAMSLSNHDFDSGIFLLSVFLYSMKFPVLCANMWARESSFLYSRVNKSAIIDVNGTKVGIVGYIHRHSLKKSKNAVSVKFLPEIPALQEEVSRLEKEGINKIIALGHAGYYTDLEIAKKVKGLDIIIGGDSDIMLFDPGHEANESSKIGNIYGNYPRVHHHEPEVENDQSLANKTLLLHIPQHGMYVGVLRATFDDQGKIIHESGEPVLLDNKIPQDEDTLDFLQFAKGALETLAEHSRLPDNEELLGKTLKHLDGNPRNCRLRECSLGNFIADAMLHEFTFHYRNRSEHRYSSEQWGPIDALVFNSGPIRRSIEPGYITIQDILKSVCLGEFIKRVYMSGKQLMEMMEHSVKHYDPLGVTPPGAFLHIAGLKVEYDLSQIPGKRVKSLFIRCRDCGDDSNYLPVKYFKTYVIGMPSFLKNGRDGFNEFEDKSMFDEDKGQFDALLLVEYLRRVFDIEPKLDGRIKFHQPDDTVTKQTIGVPPLLFGEPSNFVESAFDVPAREDIQTTSDDSIRLSTAQEVKLKDVKRINKLMDDSDIEDYISQLIPDREHEVQMNEIDGVEESHIQEDKTHIDRVKEHNLQNKEDDLLSSASDEWYYNDQLKIKGEDGSSHTTTQTEGSEPGNFSKITELLQILSNVSSRNNVNSTVEKLRKQILDLGGNSSETDNSTNEDKKIRKRSISKPINGLVNQSSYEIFLNLAERYLSDVLKNTIPKANLFDELSTALKDVEKIVPNDQLKTNVKNIEEGTEKYSTDVDFKTSVLKILRNLLDESTSKTLIENFTDISDEAKNLLSEEPSP